MVTENEVGGRIIVRGSNLTGMLTEVFSELGQGENENFRYKLSSSEFGHGKEIGLADGRVGITGAVDITPILPARIDLADFLGLNAPFFNLVINNGDYILESPPIFQNGELKSAIDHEVAEGLFQSLAEELYQKVYEIAKKYQE